MRIPNLESTFSFATSQPAIDDFLSHDLLRLNTLFSRPTVQLHELTRDSIEEGLIADRYDLAVLLTLNAVSRELALQPAIRSVRRLWLCAQHQLAKRENLARADIAVERFVMLTVDEAAFTAMRYWSETAAKSLQQHGMDQRIA